MLKGNQKLTKKPILFFLILFLLPLLIRVTFLLTYTGDTTYPGLKTLTVLNTGDEKWFWDPIARSISEGRGFVNTKGDPSFIMPGYPYFLALNYLIFGDYRYAGVRLIQALLSALTCVLIYLLGKEIYNKSVGFLAWILSSFDPMLIYLTCRLLTETLFIFLLTLSIYYLTRQYNQKPTFTCLMIIGFLLGLALLTRPVLFFFIPLLFLWFGMAFKEKKEAIISSLVVLFFILLPVLPWIIRNYTITHKLVPISGIGGHTFLWANNPYNVDGTHPRPEELSETAKDMFPKGEISDLEVDKESYEIAFDWIKNHPRDFLKLLGRKFLRFWDYYSHTRRSEVSKRYKIIGFFSFGIILPFMIIGLFLSFKEWKKFGLFCALIINFQLMALIFTSDPRKRAPLLPFLIIFASIAFFEIYKAMLRNKVMGKYISRINWLISKYLLPRYKQSEAR